MSTPLSQATNSDSEPPGTAQEIAETAQEIAEVAEFDAEVHSRAEAGRNATPTQEIADDEVANPNDLPPQADFDLLPIIGLGGSAGAVEALRDFFAHMAPDSGVAFVVVVHLAPDHESQLAQVLQTQTVMPVVRVSETVKVEANRVYVIPPGQHMVMQDGMLRLDPLQNEFGKRVAVDLFFRSLAASHRSRAVAVVLSGLDSDGAIGIKRIKEHGGVTVAQDPSQAQHEGMPRAAIATGMVDWVLPVEEIARRLGELARNENKIQLPPAERDELRRDGRELGDADEAALREILSFLQARTRHDFTHYKRATVLRRILRRLQVNALLSLPDYLTFLRTHAGEAGALLQDLLISVTNFFRDPEAFEALRENIPLLFKNKRAGDQVRVWVAGCATGEEAYSLAMLLVEHADSLPSPPALQIFATDIDEEALRFAREGRYPQAIAADVSPERLRRFFQLDQGMYRVRADLRDMVLFAAHNLLRDAPFSRMDLISCRNLLIYFRPPAQENVFNVFHFALVSDGVLFLGGSEAPDEGAQFTPLDKKHRLYTRRSVPRTPFALPPLPIPAPLPSFDPRLSFQGFTPPSPRPAMETVERGGANFGELHLQLLEAMAPPSVLVNVEADILHLSPGAGRFLRFAGGAASTNLLSVVHPQLRLELRAALFRAAQNGESVDVRGVRADIEGQPRLVNLRVRPLRENPEGEGAVYYLLVVFDDSRGDDAPDAVLSREDDSVAQRLDRELSHLKEHLRQTVEQYEATTEELKASNEELQAMNEELRSAGEELETSREELQATNEELLTVNAEMKSKVEETSRANSDLQNLMGATQIATVFLDRHLRIKRYTPPAVELFNFIPTDTGRPINDLRHCLDYPGLRDDAESVLRLLMPIEREVQSDDGRWFLSRVQPYRTVEDRIDGLVLTFVDISGRKRAEAEVRERDALLSFALQSSGAGLSSLDLETGVGETSAQWRDLFGFPPPPAPQTFEMFLERVHPDDRARVEALHREAPEQQTGLDFEFRIVHPTRGERWILSRSSFQAKEAQAGQLVGIALDITQRKQAEELLRESEGKYRTLFDSIDEGFCIIEMMDDEAGARADFRYLEVNQAWGRLTGLGDVVGKLGSEVLPGNENYWLETFDQVAQTGEALRFENYNAETRRWYSAHISRIGDQNSRRVAIVFDDVTQRKRRERQQEFLLKLADALRPLVEAREIELSACRLLGEWIGAHRVYYVEISESQGLGRVSQQYLREGAGSIAGDYPIKAFDWTAPPLRRGETVIVPDVHQSEIVPPDGIAAMEAVQQFAVVLVPLVKEGQWVGVLAIGDDAPRDWKSEDVELAQETLDRMWASAQRARAEELLRESEERYRALFTSMDEAYAVVEVLQDENGAWNDFLFLEVNPAFVQQTGMEYPVGRRATELLGTPNPHWAQIYGRVAQTGEPVRFEESEPTLGRVFDLYCFRLSGDGSRRVAVLFNDITERKQQEQQQQFLLKFSDALRAQHGADAVANRALEMIAEQLRLDRSYIGVYRLEEDWGDFTHQVGNERVPPVPAGVRLSDFPEALRVAFDRTLVIEDIAETEGLSDTDRRNIAALGFGALVAATLRKGDNNPLWSIIAVSASPRRWTPGEIALLEEVTERTWAAIERARAETALAKSEEKYRTLFETIDEGFVIQEVIVDEGGRVRDLIYHESNAVFEAQSGLHDAVGKRASELLPQLEQRWLDALTDVYQTGEPLRTEGYSAELDRWFSAHYSPVGGAGSQFIAAVFDDITQRKRHERRQEFILKLADTLRPLSNAAEIQTTACQLLGEYLNVDRAYFVEVSEAENFCRVREHFGRSDSPSMVGTYRLEDYGWSLPIMRRDETIVFADVSQAQSVPPEFRPALLAIQIVAHIAVPLVRGGAVVGVLCVTEPTPRLWTTDEVDTMREVADRLWATVERARTEEALRESEERFRLAAQASQLYAWEADFVAGRAWFSDNTAALFGYEQLPANWRDLVGSLEAAHPDDRESLREAVARAIESGDFYTATYRMLTASGDSVWVESRANVIRDETGRALRMHGVALNVHARKLAEEALRESEARLQKAISIQTVGVLFFRLDGQVQNANDAAVRMFGYTRDELLAITDWKVLTSPEFLGITAQTAQNLATRGETPPYEKKMRRKDGSSWWGLVAPTRLSGADEGSECVEFIIDISEAKRAEAALRESEERLRAMIANLPGGAAFVFDRELRYVLVGGDALEFAETTPSDLEGKTIFEALSPERAKQHAEYLRPLLEGQPFEIEHDDYGRTFVSRGVPLRDENGEVTQILAVSYDITARKHAEDALRQSREQLSAIVNQTTAGIVQSDASGHIVFANDKFAEMLGYTPEELLGTEVLDLTHPDDRQSSLPHIARLLAEGQPFEIEKRLVRRDGSFVWVHNSVSGLRDTKGQVDGLLIVSVNVSEHKAAEAALRASEERFRALIEHSAEAITVSRRDGTVFFASPAVETVSGYTPEEFAGRNPFSNGDIHPDDLRECQQKLEELLDNEGQTLTIQHRYKHKNGEWRWLEGSFTSLFLVPAVRGLVANFRDITEREAAREALRETAERLQLVMESVTEYAIITLDLKGIITGWNTGAEKTFGWTSAEAIGQHTRLLFTPEDRQAQAPEKEMESALLRGRAEDERWHVRKDGTHFFASGVLSPLQDGETNGFVKIARDLTRERQAQAALHESEARFRMLSDAVPQVIWANDADGYANYFNSRWFEYSGLSLEASLGPGWQNIVHPDDALASKELWQQALERGEIFDTEYRLRRADGQYRWFIGRNVPLKDDTERVIGWFGTATDIHDLKEAEAALRESAERFRAMFEQATAGVAEYDLNGKHLFVNDTFRELLGYSCDELMELRFSDITHPDDLPGCHQLFERAKSQGGSVLSEKRLLCKNGEVVWITESVSGIRDAGGHTQSVVAVSIDITQRKRAEEELQRSHELLEVRVAHRTHELALALERVRAEVEQRRAAESGRAELMKRIVNTQEEERGRISRELHDNLGQHLTAVMLGLQSLEMQIGEITGGQRKTQLPQLQTLRDLVDGLMRAAHRQAWELRPAELDAMGLEAALTQYIRDWSSRTGLPVDLQAFGWEERRPSREIETTLYRIVQEALTNVARHANATQVSVVLELGTNSASAIIEDDGEGFDPEASAGRLGIIGMRERLSLIGGSLEIESSSETGTTVFARVPVGEKTSL